MRVLRISAAVIGAAALSAAAAAADTDSPGRTRVTIRGTGSGVAIERTQEPGRSLTREMHLPPGPLGDAIAMKLQGVDDATVIALLRRRQADLPPVIEAADVKLLRQAGAGKSVTQFLASVAAVDLGPMGEGREAVIVSEPSPEMESPSYGLSYGYAVPGGFVPTRPAHFGHRTIPHFRHVAFRPPFHVPHPLTTHAAVGRFETTP